VREPAANSDIDEIRDAVRQLVRGRSNATGTVTLTPGATTTVVSAPFNVSARSRVGMSPTTANAAAALTTTFWVAGNGSFTITHANNAQADRTFIWSAQG
jgi:hypothetical protein